MMKRYPIHFVAALLFFYCNPFFALGQDNDSLPKNGFDSDPFEKYEAKVKSEIEDGKIVGCSAFLLKDDKVVYDKLWGHRDRENDLPVKKDTIWRIYSMTKPITSVAVMQLVENGKLDLDEPVATYLPEFKNLQVLKGDELVDCERPMTVRDLLRHTSGLTYGYFGNSEVDQQYRRSGVMARNKDLQGMVEKLGEIPLLHQPGTLWHYSVSTDVLGRVVEVASEQSFKNYLQENIFDPLDMNDTFFTVPENKRDRFAAMYSPDDDGGLKLAAKLRSYRFLNETDFHSGGGGLCSTTQDYVQFCKMMLGNGTLGDAQILTPESVAEMTKDQLPKGAGRGGMKFGLGFHISEGTHYAWGGAAGTRFWVDPDNNIIGVFMIQINPYQADEYGYEFKTTTYEALK